MTRRISRWLLTVAVLSLLPATAPAQPRVEPIQPKQPRLHPDGLEAFCGLMVLNKITPLTREDLNAPLNYSDVIVIILGVDLTPIKIASVHAANALRGGGSLLIAADAPFFLGTLIPGNDGAGVNVRVTGWPLKNTDQKPDVIYRGEGFSPFAVPLEPPADAGPEWDLFRDLNRVATSKPSCLELPERGSRFATPLARFPVGTEFGRNLEQWDLPPHMYPLAAGSSGKHPQTNQPYRFLALADPSLFINEMMVPAGNAPPTDNLEFTHRTITFLQERPDRSKRSRCLMYVDGVPIKDFGPIVAVLRQPEPPLPTPPPLRKILLGMQDKLVDAGNQVLDRVQESDMLNSIFLGGGTAAERGHRFRERVGWLLFLASIWAVWQVLRRVWGSRQPSDIPPPPPGGRPAAASASAGVFDRRQRELLRRNNLYEPVRDAIREMFTTAAAPTTSGLRLPRVEIASTVHRPETLRKALTELWRVGYGTSRVMTVHQWARLEPLFVRARRALADGKWRFAEPGPTPAESTGSRRAGAEAGA